MASTGVVKGPWSEDEDEKLLSYIKKYGHGHWETLARKAGLNRTGKSCRLRWLNYLRPGVRRGNITLQEQLIILQLHSRWGNRWAKIAEYLPGRSDNEIKNYWRTRVQKQAKQLQCDVNSNRFKEIMHHIWMPQLAERVAQTQFEISPTLTNVTLSNQSKSQSTQPDAVVQSIPSQESHQPLHNHNDSNENVVDPKNLTATLHSIDGYKYAKASCENMTSSENCPWIWRQYGLESNNEQQLATAAWFDDDKYSLDSLLNDEEMVFLCQKLMCDDDCHMFEHIDA